MRVVPVPCLADNYAYLVICDDSHQAAVVDPSDAAPVLDALEREGVHAVAIWNTHHHQDHTGGNLELCRRAGPAAVVGHASDRGRIPGQTDFVCDGQTVRVGQLVATILHNPGHTRGAVSYHLAGPGWLFTGDTLFGAGCGRLFEGSPADMHTSLAKLAALPDHTLVYCGHEYTEKNLCFAAEVEPHNAAIAARLARVRALRARSTPSVPSRLDDERATNPFLRVSEPAVVVAACRRDPAASDSTAVFAALRTWKDRF